MKKHLLCAVALSGVLLTAYSAEAQVESPFGVETLEEAARKRNAQSYKDSFDPAIVTFDFLRSTITSMVELATVAESFCGKNTAENKYGMCQLVTPDADRGFINLNVLKEGKTHAVGQLLNSRYSTLIELILLVHQTSVDLMELKARNRVTVDQVFDPFIATFVNIDSSTWSNHPLWELHTNKSSVVGVIDFLKSAMPQVVDDRNEFFRKLQSADGRLEFKESVDGDFGLSLALPVNYLEKHESAVRNDTPTSVVCFNGVLMPKTEKTGGASGQTQTNECGPDKTVRLLDVAVENKASADSKRSTAPVASGVSTALTAQTVGAVNGVLSKTGTPALQAFINSVQSDHAYDLGVAAVKAAYKPLAGSASMTAEQQLLEGFLAHGPQYGVKGLSTLVRTPEVEALASNGLSRLYYYSVVPANRMASTLVSNPGAVLKAAAGGVAKIAAGAGVTVMAEMGTSYALKSAGMSPACANVAAHFSTAGGAAFVFGGGPIGLAVGTALYGYFGYDDIKSCLWSSSVPA